MYVGMTNPMHIWPQGCLALCHSKCLAGPRKTRNGRKGTGNGEWGMGNGNVHIEVVFPV